MDETLKANYLANLAILSGLVYNLETVITIISEETMYGPSIVRYFVERTYTIRTRSSDQLGMVKAFR